MVLSDGAIRRLIEAGRIGIDPYDPALMQPSSLDVRADRYFRVFRNSRYPYIDVTKAQDELTELVETADGEPFILHPGEFVLGSTLERVTLPDDLVARLEGKALALDTQIPTPAGWRLMAELAPGDLVFAETGEPTVVVAATEPIEGRPCREVVFSDGTTVVCDAAHRWETSTRTERMHGRRDRSIRTTEAIRETLVVGGERNHQVALAAPALYPTRELPIDPYVFGALLGDGTRTKAQIARADDEMLAHVVAAGHSVAERGKRRLSDRIGGTGQTRDASTGRLTAQDSLDSSLRYRDVFQGKRIPPDYLRADVFQRRALLEGLMDAGGQVDRFGRCELTTFSEALARDAHELVASLGSRPVIDHDRATLDGRDRGRRFRLSFTPGRPVFRLTRKLARQKTNGCRHRFRTIVEVREAESVPVRCIEVSSPRGLFLVSRSYIPTHNSSLGRLGLLIHSTAGFIDPGWDGHITLELSNVANLPITIYPEMKIGQLSFVRLSEPAEQPYGSAGIGSKYQGQRGPTPSRYYKNFESE